MRRQYSLVWTFGFVAFAAVAVAGFVEPKSIWNSVNFWLWLAMLCYWGIAASGDSVFARAALAWTVVYVCATQFEMYAPFFDNQALLPHSWLLSWTPAPPSVSLSSDTGMNDFEAEIGLERAAMVNTSLLFGLLGGALAVGLARRRQRPGDLQKA